jgi:hypothetical protein
MYAAVAVLGLHLCPSAHGAVTFNVSQLGPDVFITGSGSYNTAAMGNPLTNVPISPTLQGVAASIAIGLAGNTDLYGSSGSGPTSFGTSGFNFDANLGTGNIFGFTRIGDGSCCRVIVPTGYVSGSQLSGTSTYTNKTISSMALTPGTYVWTWGSGASADSFTLNIGIIVPEPSTFGLAGLGLLALIARSRKSRLATRNR